jgi:hypothetical protein
MYYKISRFSRQAYTIPVVLIRVQITGDAFKARTGFYACSSLPTN